MKFHHKAALALVWGAGLLICYFLREHIPLILSASIYLIISTLVLVFLEHRTINTLHQHNKIMGVIEEVRIHHYASKKVSHKADEYRVVIFFTYGETAGEKKYTIPAEDYKQLQSRIGHLESMPVTILVGEETQPDIDFLKRYAQ